VRRSTSLLLVLLLAVTAPACGYVLSGEWDEDPDNWGRAFHSTKPPDVTVVHSLVWRAPHFTYEGGYFFELEPNRALHRQLFEQNALRRARSDGGGWPRKPWWFAPKEPRAYEIWRYADDPFGNFRVLIDRSTGHIFIADYQL
jgi:hypothetical protein